MYFPAEHLLAKLQMSAAQLEDFEGKGVVHGISRVGRVFYSSRDIYRLKGILLFMSRGLTLAEAQQRVDQPAGERSVAESRR